jgi:alkaline phosphatase
MHTLDYDRALGELLELDDTVRASIAHLNATGQLADTLIIVTADHGHGFDVMGSVDTKYLNAQKTDREKRDAIGTYQNSGLSQYVVANTSAPDGNLIYTDGVYFPTNWDPRYTLFSALGADPDRRENYQVHKDQGVHSLTDVPVFAQGPCQELFSGVYGNIDIFYGMAECLGLSQTSKGASPKWSIKTVH